MKTAIVNIGPILSGDWRSPYVQGDAILTSLGEAVTESQGEFDYS